MATYIIDIETKPNEDLSALFNADIKAPSNYKDEEKIRAYIEKAKADSVKKMSTSTHYSSIDMVGVKILNGQPQILCFERFAEILQDDQNARFITYNGKSFDIPVIIMNGMYLNIDLPYEKLYQMTKRWVRHEHIDLMELLCFGNYMSLDKLAQIYLGERKEEIDFETVSKAELEQHCIADLELTEKLYEKFEQIATFTS